MNFLPVDRAGAPIDLSIYEEAAKLVEAGWTQNAMARDANGRQIAATIGEGAVCFCMQGAVLAVARARGLDTDECWTPLTRWLPKPVEFNDKAKSAGDVAAKLREYVQACRTCLAS